MILYEERHFLFASKVAGISSQRIDAPEMDEDTSLPQDTLEQQLERFILARDGKLGFLQLVHRLDRVASGIVLFARSSKALSRLHESLRKRLWQKFYLAFVYCKKDLPKADGILEDYLIHGDRKALVGLKTDPNAKRSHLEYTLLMTKKNTALLGIHLHTGRYHQIRAQLSGKGWPIIGDALYGGPAFSSSQGTFCSYPGIALHHVDLTIPHPIEKDKKVNVFCPPAKELLDAVQYTMPEVDAALKKFEVWRSARS